MYRVITCNTNGIRAAARKGFFTWLAEQNADVVCIQEIKAKEVQLTDRVFYPEGYYCYYNEADRPGYSGTAVFCRRQPDRVITRLDWEIIDTEGRYVQVDFPGLSVISLYVPSGSSSDAAQARKDAFMGPSNLSSALQFVRGQHLTATAKFAVSGPARASGTSLSHHTRIRITLH